MASKTKKPTKANFTIYVDVYGKDLMCSFGETDDELKERLRGKVDDDELDRATQYNNRAVAYWFLFQKGAQLIRFPGIPEDLETHGTIQHELLHATFGILKCVDIRLCEESEEAFTYLHAHLTRELYRKLKPYL